MTEEPKNTRKKTRASSEGEPFTVMMQKMMDWRGRCCDCVETMSQMMKTCCQSRAEEEKRPTKTNQKA